jgi:hypothetical protein
LKIGILVSERLALESKMRIPVLKNTVKNTPTLIDLIVPDLVSSRMIAMSAININFNTVLTTLIMIETEYVNP